MGFQGDLTFISQLDSLGNGCRNVNVNQTYFPATFSIQSNQVSITDSLFQITVWNDTITNSSVSLTFSKNCGGYVNIPDQIKNTQQIKIYPNPTSDDLTIEDLQKSTLEITNIQGQTILQQTLQQGKTDIDIRRLAKGVYILRLCSNDKTVVTKIVKE